VERSAAVVQRYGGTVEYNGDGVMLRRHAAREPNGAAKNQAGIRSAVGLALQGKPTAAFTRS
jgi:hypothetical protein